MALPMAPLEGRRIVVTRAQRGAQRFARMLRKMGAEVVEFPTIETVPPDSYAVLDAALARLKSFNWLIFTSATGVDAFIERLRSSGHEVADAGGLRIAAIGPATARRLADCGLQAAKVPAEYRAEAIIDAIGEDRIRDARFLIPRAQVAREKLPEMLAVAGAREVVVAPAYRTTIPRDSNPGLLRKLIDEDGIDLVTFTSSSTVENFCALAGTDATRARAAVIGPITADTARLRGFQVVVSPADYTVEALARAICDYFGQLPTDASPSS